MTETRSTITIVISERYNCMM